MTTGMSPYNLPTGRTTGATPRSPYFNNHIADASEVVERLRPFDVVCLMRERTPLTREILQSCSETLRSTARAADLGIAVTAIGHDSTPIIEFTWSLILASTRASIGRPPRRKRLPGEAASAHICEAKALVSSFWATSEERSRASIRFVSSDVCASVWQQYIAAHLLRTIGFGFCELTFLDRRISA
jgi:hypothetical protein